MRFISRTSIIIALLNALMVSQITGCKDMLGDPPLPENVRSPSMYNTREGAIELARAATVKTRDAIVSSILWSGLLTDELSNRNPSLASPLDTRNFPSGAVSGTWGGDLYILLHGVRSQARIARGALKKYAPDVSSQLTSELYMYEAYAEILLADIYCSGIPLSTVDFEADFTYRPSSTSAQVYQHAIALLDSALDGVDGDIELASGIRVLKARALNVQGLHSEAKAVAELVETSVAYGLKISFWPYLNDFNQFNREATVSDREGENGLPYISSGDPRTSVDTLTAETGKVTVNYPDKYRSPDSTLFVIGSGIEARLIEAEQALRKDNIERWISVLNDLRTTGSYSGIDTVFEGGVVIRVDTLWLAGSGWVSGLGVLRDPGTYEGRIDLLFAERAAWLFLTGSRQGDLRRLVNMYGRDGDEVYPTGAYLNPGASGGYGDNIWVPIPETEYRNPHFGGCLSDD